MTRSARWALLIAVAGCGRQPLDGLGSLSDGGSDGAASVSGCGKPLPASQPPTVPGQPTGYLRYTVMGTGATLAGPAPEKAGSRTFWVRVPADYDSTHAYRVVYLGQGCGSYDAANTTTYPLYNEAAGGDEQAIYVALDLPRNLGDRDCYDDQSGTSSEEWEAFELFQTVVDQTYCVDNDQIFVAGFATGGRLANMWGCYFAGDGEHPWNGVPSGGGASAPRQFAPRYHVRGQAVVNGGEPANNPPCNGPVAAIWIHDMGSSNPIADDQAALARVLRMNGCVGSPQAPWVLTRGASVFNDNNGCVKYTGCAPETPVIFCTTVGRAITSQESLAIPAFTQFIHEVLSPPAAR